MNGWIGILGENGFSHCFGGNDWAIRDPSEICGGPTLLLNLDLSDPRLQGIEVSEMEYFPICSYVNCDVWIETQRYRIINDSKELILIDRALHPNTSLIGDLTLPNPLERRSLTLRSMTNVELGLSDDDYWKACDSFVGGSSFLRILGPPIWLQDRVCPQCSCGEEPKYICSIGYDYSNVSGILLEKGFFIGEAALYFFFCNPCKELVVISQPT